MSFIKDTLVGLALIAIIFIIVIIYCLYSDIRNEDSKRGVITRLVGKIGNGMLWAYIAICSIIGLIIGLITLCFSQ